MASITVVGNPVAETWSQASGGDVYASADLVSNVSYTTVPRQFITAGTGGTPGVASYGSSFDFDEGPGNGAAYVSPTNWLVNETHPTIDYYTLMFRRFGGTPATWDYDQPSNPITQPAYKANMDTPYYVNGDMTTSGDWSVATGKKLVFIVNGNLTINGKINTVGTGFVAFIVNGTITVDPSVGSAFNSAAPDVEGVYITNPLGIFDTGDSSVPGHERFVGRGTFVAGSFKLQRDLGDVDNAADSAELFIYNPANLMTMPDAMKESPINWQEVAP